MKRELTKEELESIKEKDEVLSKMVELIGDHSLTYKDVAKLREELDDTYHPEDLSTEELIDQLEGNYLDYWDKSQLMEMCGCSDYAELSDFYDEYKFRKTYNWGGSVDDQMRSELLMKLGNSVSSLTELETLLGDDILERLKFVLI